MLGLAIHAQSNIHCASGALIFAEQASGRHRPCDQELPERWLRKGYRRLPKPGYWAIELDGSPYLFPALRASACSSHSPRWPAHNRSWRPYDSENWGKVTLNSAKIYKQCGGRSGYEISQAHLEGFWTKPYECKDR
jgi:hypothetical protein